MRLFKKSALQQHQQEIISSAYYPSQLDFERLQQQNIRENNLAHVMHLFEEKNKYHAAPVNGPLPIKANGAIVVNRPGNEPKRSEGTIKLLPLFYDDIDEENGEGEDDDEENVEGEDDDEEEGEDDDEENMAIKCQSTIENTSSGGSCDDSNSDSSINIELHAIQIVHEENKRLRQQILVERELHEKWRVSQETLQQELSLANNQIKNLTRLNDRFQNMLLPNHKNIQVEHLKRSRRQSTTSLSNYDNNTDDIAISYERKLQILLNEIDAMEIQEKELLNQVILEKNENEKLSRKLTNKDDIIRQIAYDLQYQKSVMSF